MRKILAFLCPTFLAAAVLAQVPAVTITFPNGLNIVPSVTMTYLGSAVVSPQTVTSPATIVLAESQTPSQIYYNLNGQTPGPGNPTSILCSANPCNVVLTTSVTLNAMATASGSQGSIVTSAIFNVTLAPTANPTFSPDPGISAQPWSVSVADATAGAAINCTTDNTTPTSGSPLYSVPFTFNTPGVATLKCIAKASGLTASAVVTGLYNYQPPAPTPTISPSGTGALTYTSSVPGGVILQDTCSGANIYYTLDGTAPSTSSAKYTGPISITSSALVTAMATCLLYAQSAAVSQSYIVVAPQQAPVPTFVPSSTSNPSAFSVVINDAAPSATICYTNDGTPATPTHGTCTAAPVTISITVSQTVNAIATAPTYTTSAQGSAVYTITGGQLASCPSTSGSLTLKVTNPRAIGISHLQVYFDATSSTDSSIPSDRTAFQAVSYGWNFGDGGVSGAGAWQNGSNAGHNSMNTATGGIAVHVYVVVPGGGDPAPFQPIASATDGTNSTSCQTQPVTAYDPGGAHGFGGAATTCVSSAAVPVAGVGGCPLGATVLQTSSVATALGGTFMGNGRRVLFHCGETFNATGANSGSINPIKYAVGAYGGCENTQVGNPILSAGSSHAISIGASASDGRISDLMITGTATLGSNGNAAIQCNGNVCTLLTIWNVQSIGPAAGFYDFNGTQVVLAKFVGQPMGNINTFLNPSENQCASGTNNNFGGCPGGTFRLVDYNAIIGSYFDGQGRTSGTANIEVVRISACRLCVISNNTIKGASTGGAVLKIHNGNPSSQTAWLGQYTELMEISDNLFTGNAGAQMVEVAPQNSQTDERLRNIVLERNMVVPVGSSGGESIMIGGQNITVRDTVCYNVASSNGSCVEMGRRGIEWGSVYWGYALESCPGNFSHPSQCTGNATADHGTPYVGYGAEPSGNEIFNVTIVQTKSNTGITAAAKCNGASDPTCSGGGSLYYQGGGNYVQSVLMYSTAGGSLYQDAGNPAGANTVNSNSTSVNANPLFTDPTGIFSLITDFTPTANDTGGAATTNIYDAVCCNVNTLAPLNPLGALHP